MRHFLSVILIVLGGWAMAQSYPEPSDLAVNDFAGIIGDEAEERLVEKLNTLREDTDVEMVVLTLSRQEIFAPDISLKKFARGIFDEWGIGDKKRDDGILVLVLRGDQAIRITLGEAYGNKADKASDKAVERSFLPEFREARYEQGIENGVTDLIENLVLPYVEKRDEDADVTTAAAEGTGAEGGDAATSDGAGTAQTDTATGTTDTTAATATGEATASAEGSAQTGDGTEGGGGSSILWYILGGIGALIGFFVFKSKTRKCPECGARGSLKTTTNTVIEATEDSSGKGERITTCEKCDHRDVQTYEIAKKSKPEPEPKPAAKPQETPDDFSGGKAGKKGTTGKW